MHGVQIDRYMHHSMHHAVECIRCRLTHANAITFLVLVFLQQKFPQMFFITRHVNPGHFIQIDQKLLEFSIFASNHLARPKLQDFSKKLSANRCFVTQLHFSCSFVCNENLQYAFHTYPHNP